MERMNNHNDHGIISSLLKRFPLFTNILPVYAVAAFMAYGWNIIHFLWKVPSWLLFLTLGEILSLLAYAMTAALVESLIILAAVLLIAFLLPESFFKRDFIVRATWLILAGYGGMMIMLSLNTTQGQVIGRYWSLLSLILPVLAGLAAYISTRVAFLRSAALWLSDQLIIFLFILVPASLISVITVLLRNLPR